MNYLQKKKLAFMSIVNRVKGFICTITGVLPLTLEGCVDDESIIDYTLYGQSVQDGTPNPNNPVEVESWGERTKNLLNPSNFTGGSLVEYNGVQCYKYSDGGSGNFTYADDFKENTRYVFTFKIYSADTTKNTAIKLTYADGTSVPFVINKSDTKYSLVTASDKTLKSIQGEWYYGVTRYIDLTVSQIEEGTTASEYEPYGYKIPIKVSGKNLFNENDVIASVDNWYYIGGSYSYGLNLEVGKQYRFSCDVINNPGVFSASICRKPKIADWSFTTLYSIVGKSSTTGKKSYTFVADGTECLWLYCDGGNKLDLYKEFITENIKNFQLEEGTATDYEPYHKPITTNIYLDEPLRKVGDYADYIKSVDLVNGTGKVVRNITYERIDTVTTKSSAGLVFLSPISQKPLITGKTDNSVGYAMSDKFPRHTGRYGALPSRANLGYVNIQTYITSGGANRVAYIFGDDSITTVALAQEAIGDGFDVFYALATPTETSIVLPTIPTFRGTSILNADTTIQPSNAEVTYYSTVKE